MNSESLLVAQNLVKRYGSRTVVDQVSFDIGPGEIVGLLGRNGAGKTTTFRMVIGTIDPDGGSILFGTGGNQEDVTRLPMYLRAQKGIGYLAQEPSVFRRLTVEQNLFAILESLSDTTRKGRQRTADELLDQFGLTRLRAQKAAFLSGGERRKLEIARALITNPKLILLDEPFSGVDPKAVEDLQREIVHLKESDRRIAILLTDHNVRETLAVTDRSYILNDGVIMAKGSPREIINNADVRAAYLGNTFRGDEFDSRTQVMDPTPARP